MSPLSATRARYPSSTSSASATSSTLFASSASGSGSGTDRRGGGTRTSTVTTPASLFSDNETEVQHQPIHRKTLAYDDDRPLIDFGDGEGDGDGDEHTERERLQPTATATPTPGEKLRLLLRQMEAEVRSTTTRTAPVNRDLEAEYTHQDEHEPGPTPSRPTSHWREGRRIGALPLERSYSPEPQQEEDDKVLDDRQYGHKQEEDEDEEDSPPTPPLRITNPYLYTSRKVSEEREHRESVSPRKPSRAAVLHASTSRSPPPASQAQAHREPLPAPPIPVQQTPLQSYLARSRYTSPSSRKGKERERASAFGPGQNQDSGNATPQQAPRASISPRKPARTPRRRSVEIAPDDSVIFAQGLASGQEEEVELDLDEGESVEPPWMAESSAGDYDEDEVEEEPNFGGVNPRGGGIPDLPPIDEADSNEYEEEEEDEGMSIHPPPASRSRSRFSHSPSVSFATAAASAAPSPARSSPNKSAQDRSTSFSRRMRIPPATPSPPRVQPIPVPEPVPVRLTPSTPPKPSASTHNPTTPLAQAKTPRPPGAWLSASKPHSHGRSLSLSPLRQAHTPPRSDQGSSQDISIHRLKLSPSAKSSGPRARPEDEHAGDTSFTQRLVASILSPRKSRIPAPSRTLAEARSDLQRAAQKTETARRQVEQSQLAWLDALSASGTLASDVMRTSWTWGRWVWWITLEMMLLWGVFRVTLEYTSLTSPFSFLDPTSAPSFALAVPVPTALSAFVIPSDHRRSGANFFDLLEQAELWRYLDKLGVGVGGMERARLRVPI